MRTLIKLIVIALAMGGGVASTVPWRLRRAAITIAVSDQFAREAGIDVRLAGPITLKLLPRPRLQMSQLSAKGGDGAILIDAPSAKAELDIPSLLRGRWRLASATLIDPTVTLYLDRAGTFAPAESANVGDTPRPLRIRIRSGVLRTISANPAADAILTGIDAAATWPAKGGALTASGAMAWRGATAQFAAKIEHLSDLTSLSGSAASLQLTSPVLTLSVDGILSGEPQGRFGGHVAAFVSSLPKLLNVPIRHARPGAGGVQINGDVLASARGLSFSDASFRTKHSRFEGTLAIRRESGRTAVEGTLATDLLDVDSLLAEDAGEGDLESLYRRPLDAEALDSDVDLRVSASKARIGRLSFDDAAFAVLLRDGRFELTLDEAGFCGGHVKGRAVANLGSEQAEVHGELAATRVDIAAMSDALGGKGRVGGALTGVAALDGTGRNLGEMLATLGGHGQITIDKGRLAGLSLGRALRRYGGRLPLQGTRAGQPTVFDKAVWDFSVEHGILNIPDGKLTAPGVSMSFSGDTHLPNGRVDLRGVAAETDAGGALLSDSPALPFTMRGSWDGSVTLIGQASGGSFPLVVLPLVGSTNTSP